ncbi:PREDICTED: probable E3 SUMO-protein ligase RNF212 [Miniopterus natalensis]|uniref:probable E3 SUMO-protein ligase RNF212 n=1 Tax=Miniopterus natalensis TaxID=291302 RepID=UPI0007A6C274|nr:PREDICTED: probable E3 SUMO-protein ligase RNF212 [Miniopterus natalensis]
MFRVAAWKTGKEIARSSQVPTPPAPGLPRADGPKDECLICKVPCRTVLLSEHTDAGIQALFMGIDGLCTKYSKETSQISEFQEKHRKRLLAFYREKIARLEESLGKSMLRVEQLQSMRSSQLTAFGTMKNPVSTEPSGRLLLCPSSSASERVEPMEVDLMPSPMRRPELAAGPARVSLISPPQGGRMALQSHTCAHRSDAQGRPHPLPDYSLPLTGLMALLAPPHHPGPGPLRVSADCNTRLLLA